MEFLAKLKEYLAIKGNMRVLCIQAVVWSTGLEMMWVAWQPFVLFLGASMTILGLLQSFNSLAYSALQPVFGKISDNIGRRMPLIVGAFFSVGVLIIYTLIATVAQAWYFLIPAVLLWGLSLAVGAPAWKALVAESVTKDERGTASSMISFVSIIAGIYSPVIAGLVANQYGFSMIFVIFSFIAVINLALMFFLRETHEAQSKVILTKSDLKNIAVLFAPEKGLAGFYLLTVLHAVAWGIISTFYGMLNKEFEFTVLQLGYLSLTFSISSALVQIPVGKMIDKYGRKIFLVISESLGCLALLGFLLSSRFEDFLLFQIPLGITGAIWYTAVFALLADNTTEDRRAVAMGKLLAFPALGAFYAPIIGGFLYDKLGFDAPLFASLSLVIVELFMLFLFVHEARRSSFATN